MLEALDSNQKSRLLTEQTPAPAAGPSSPPPHQAHPGEAELAYLTHEGLFISDALSDAQQVHGGPQEQGSGLGSRGAAGPEGGPGPQQGGAAGTEASSSDSASGTTESSSSREQGFTTAGGAAGL